MKIKIKDDGRKAYMSSLGFHQPVNWEWVKKIEQIQGMTLEVETEYLFRDQFNTAPIPGVSEQGMRIDHALVKEVIDDARPGKMRCQNCGACSDKANVCPKCKTSEYRESLALYSYTERQMRDYLTVHTDAQLQAVQEGRMKEAAEEKGFVWCPILEKWECYGIPKREG